jgi:hypothetical protein
MVPVRALREQMASLRTPLDGEKQIAGYCSAIEEQQHTVFINTVYGIDAAAAQTAADL